MDGDISDFFGSLSHERLIDLVADRVADGKVLSLVRSMLTAGALVDGVFESAIAGTPQGGVVTPSSSGRGCGAGATTIVMLELLTAIGAMFLLGAIAGTSARCCCA